MKTTSDAVFNEIKQRAIDIWNTYDDTYGYATEKITYVQSIGNIKDNYLTIVGMFDNSNRILLYNRLSDEARNLIKEYI